MGVVSCWRLSCTMCNIYIDIYSSQIGCISIYLSNIISKEGIDTGREERLKPTAGGYQIKSQPERFYLLTSCCPHRCSVESREQYNTTILIVIQQEYLSIIVLQSTILHNKNFNKIIFVFPLIYENILTAKKVNLR